MLNKFIKSMVYTVAASSVLLASSAAMAEQKIAVINGQAIMQQLPQTVAMVNALKEEFKEQQTELQQIEKDFKYLQEKKKRDSALMSEKEIKELDQKLGDLYRDLQTKGQALQKELQRRNGEEVNKISALVKQSIDNIAAKGNYDLILNAEAVVHVNPDFDISAKVIEQVSKLK